MFFCRLLIFLSQTAFFRKIILVIPAVSNSLDPDQARVLSNMMIWFQIFCKDKHACIDLQHILQLLFVIRVLAANPPNHVTKPYSSQLLS